MRLIVACVVLVLINAVALTILIVPFIGVSGNGARQTPAYKNTYAESTPNPALYTLTASADETDDGGDIYINVTVKESVLLDVAAFSQRELGLPTGCEIVALAMVIDFMGIEVDVDALVAKKPLSQNPYEGFRGNPATAGGFTIFPSALMGITEEYLGSAHDMSGYTVNELKMKLSEDKPVVAWVNGLGWNVHAVTLTGYDGGGFYYNDPWTGAKDVFIAFDEFYRIWNNPIRDNILNRTSSPRKALSF
jgi:uncharacterized protein YvpB